MWVTFTHSVMTKSTAAAGLLVHRVPMLTTQPIHSINTHIDEKNNDPETKTTTNIQTTLLYLQALDAPYEAMEAVQNVWAAQEIATAAAKEPRPSPNPAWTITDRLRDMLAPPTMTVSKH